MKKILCLMPYALCLFFISGCQESAKTEKAVETTVKANSNFPQIMVGVWEADVNDGEGSKWGIKFEHDGSIRKIIHSVAGPINLNEGGIYEEGPDKGNFVYFIMGPCTSDYNSTTGMLKVKIVVDDYLMKLPTGELHGKIEDRMEGPISSDGKTWKVEWRDYGYLEGADTPDYNEVDANPVILMFTKIDIKKLKKGIEKSKVQ